MDFVPYYIDFVLHYQVQGVIKSVPTNLNLLQILLQERLLIPRGPSSYPIMDPGPYLRPLKGDYADFQPG